MAQVIGVVWTEDGRPVFRATVRAYDKDLRHEQILGEAKTFDIGGYTISYTETQFRRADKKTADLILREFDEQDNLRAESEIIFNAREEERVDLTFGPLPQPPERRLTELEELQEALEPVREGVEYADFTDQDIEGLLVNELARGRILGRLERALLLERLRFLRLADQLFRTTQTVLAAFYGWFRKDLPQDLEGLLSTSTSRLREALRAAIDERIIPDILAQIDEILEQLYTFQFETERLVSHSFMGQLLNSETDEPLPDFRIRVFDQDAEPERQNLGEVTTEGQGLFEVFFVLPADAPENASCTLRLLIHNEEGEEVADITVTARPNQEEVEQIRIQLAVTPDLSAPIESVAPLELARILAQRNIRTLKDLLRNLNQTADLDTPDMRRLKARAKLNLIVDDVATQAAILDQGYTSLLDIARDRRANFVDALRGRLGGDAKAAELYEKAQVYRQLLENTSASLRLGVKTEPDDEDDVPLDIQQFFLAFLPCGCEDCDAAVSPLAYLADLLSFIREHLKDGDNAVTISFLENTFHKPFRTLPASCKAVDQKVRQVRTCIIAIRRFITASSEGPGFEQNPQFDLAYRHYRNTTYQTLLNKVGSSFEELRRYQPAGETFVDSELADSRRQALAQRLGINVVNLIDLFLDIYAIPNPVTEANIQQLFGFQITLIDDPLAEIPTPFLQTFQLEHLRTLWQQQDWINDDYSNHLLPIVNPLILTEAYFREPLAENLAFSLFQTRSAAVEAYRQQLIQADPQTNGLVPLIESELGQTIDQLQLLANQLQTGVNAETALQQVEALHLTVGSFTRLMAIETRFQQEESLEEAEAEALWPEVFNILTRAHVVATLYPEWINEEENQELLFGPKLFWLPVDAPEAPAAWLAPTSEREQWQAALQRCSRPPLIDPNNLTLSNFRFDAQPNVPPGQITIQPAFFRWTLRNEWLEEILTLIRQARLAETTASDRLQAALTASELGISIATLEELATALSQGQDIQSRLAQLSLTPQEYVFLAEIQTLAGINATIADSEWEQVDAILAQMRKRREYADWHRAETEEDFEVTLRPDLFALRPEDEVLDDSAQSQWLIDLLAYRQWADLLEARINQQQALIDALKQAISETEAVTLPLLRDALILRAGVPGTQGTGLEAKADRLAELLLTDTKAGGCLMTTWVSEAINTLQLLLWGVRTGQLKDPLDNLTFADQETEENFDRIWQWMGSYATWKSAMQVFLYPENILLPTLKTQKSYGFSRIIGRSLSQVKPEGACRRGHEYANYFRDICNLEVQASCQVATPVTREEGCHPVVVSNEPRVHMFALATTSGKVYTASFNSLSGKGDTLTSWHPVPDVTNVVQIIGAVPHETPTQHQLILLFVKVRQESITKLKVIHFDLNAMAWLDSFDLAPPPGAEIDFSAVALQKRSNNSIGFVAGGGGFTNSPGSSAPKRNPTILAIRTSNGRIFVRNLNRSATTWAGDDWMPLVGDVLAQQIAEVCALVQRDSIEYVMVVRMHNGWLQYRVFAPASKVSDDGIWRSIAQGEFAGAFTWPQTPDVYVFYRVQSQTKYAFIQEPSSFTGEGLQVKSILALEGWLKSTAGVSLENFTLDFTFFFSLNKPNPDFDPEQPISDNLANPPVIPLDGIHVHQFAGNLLQLLTLKVSNWDYEVPQAAVETKDELLKQIQEFGLDTFTSSIEELDQVDFQNQILGQWKIADLYIRQFASGKGLATAVEEAFEQGLIKFPFRGFISESRLVNGEALPDQTQFIPSGGDEESGANLRKAIAVQMSNGTFRMQLQRSGDILSSPPFKRIIPRGNGPFDISPQISAVDLQHRKTLIEATYGLNSSAYPSVLIYLHEAYRDVPLHLALQLQRNGHYQEALDWFRLVYDYTQTLKQRKIDYSLVQEEDLEFKVDRADDWLDDATNPHAIAVTRSNTYTSFTLLSIIRCLLDYADAEFTFDTAESLARARTLYEQALELLETPELNRSLGFCDDIIGNLQIDVTEPWQGNQVKGLKTALTHIKQPDLLQSTVITLQETAANLDLDPVEKFQRLRAIVNEAVSNSPPPKLLEAVVQDKSTHLLELENRLLPHEPASRNLTKLVQQRGQRFVANVSAITGIPEVELDNAELPWLRSRTLTVPSGDANPNNGNGRSPRIDRRTLNPLNPRPLATVKQITAAMPLQSLAATNLNAFSSGGGLSFDFCIPPNPVLKALQLRATLNLHKLRNCLNIAGMQRQVEPYAAPIDIESGLPLIGASGNLVLPGLPRTQPTPYRFAFLLERAKTLVDLAQQMESAFLSALANAEQEEFVRLQAQHSIGLAQAKEKLQRLRVGEARGQVGLAILQQTSALVRATTYAGWIAAGSSQYEQAMLQAYKDAGTAQQNSAFARATGQAASAAMSAFDVHPASPWSFGKIPLAATVAASAIAEGAYNVQAIQAETSAQTNSALASFERREQEWGLQQSLAEFDVQIGNQQIQLAQSQLQVVGQEHTISQLEVEQATEILTFLHTKFLNEELYRWMSDVLESVYRYFLQQATAVAKLAENQLAFERQEAPAAYIQADYWNVPNQGNGFTNPGETNVDRRGLTGSARLLQDLFKPDQYAIDTNKRKLQLSKTFDLAQLFPIEFQRFRETGILVFPTSMELFDRDFPGHYLRLISQVRTSVVALVSPTEGIKAMLTSSGISRVMIGGDIFQALTIRRQPEQVALTSSISATGVFELDPQSELLRPFEGSGVDTLWEFRLPKATNRFDFNTIATVLVTIDYTALDSYTYRQQVLQKLDRNVSFDRAFSFRTTFADAWYDLNNPDQTTTPMVIQFETRRADFPPNLDNLRIQHIALHFVRADVADLEIEIPTTHLLFTSQDGSGTVGGGATTIDGITISTRRGNGISLTPTIGLAPFGTWELAFPDAPEVLLPDGRRVRDLFETEEVVDILFVITYAGQVPEYPA